MQSDDVIFIGICGGVDAGQMVAIEQHGDRTVDIVKTVQKIKSGLIRVIQSLGICVQIELFV